MNKNNAGIKKYIFEIIESMIMPHEVNSESLIKKYSLIFTPESKEIKFLSLQFITIKTLRYSQ